MGTRNVILVWYRGKWQIAQYTQWDGFPEGQGIRIVRFLQNKVHPDQTSADKVDERHMVAEESSAASDSQVDDATAAQPKDNVAALKAALNRDILYTPTEEQMEEWWADAKVVSAEAEAIKDRIRTNQKQMSSEEVGEEMERHQLMDALVAPLMIVVPSMSRDCGSRILSLVACAKERVPVKLEVEFVVDSMCEWAYVVDLDEDVLEVYHGTQGSNEGKGRFDDANFVVEGGCRPFMAKRYRFGELAGMTEKVLRADVNAVLKEHGLLWEESSERQ
ncbi:hypothetical protein PMZ80_010947 [Knufia obscura]|uniref:Uncharacterized protein n=2 Tax=Knufia TaxID=430999 RepID=A0AAN8EEK9_9EURO|nr:hypothetical protein PMZ80_010947 [Knufia obscura]KAK5948852.1 hypothetical protein OHC33_010103 [Knufia fluminis]